MPETKLKHCPFCGGRAKIEENNSFSPFSEEITYLYVRCSKCGCEPFRSKRVTNVHFQKNYEEILAEPKQELAKKWNRRAENENES